MTSNDQKAAQAAAAALRAAEAVENAREAQALLENPRLDKAFKEIAAEYHRVWAITENQEGRDELWRALRALDAFRNHLHNTVSNGRIAEEQIAKLAKRA